MNVISTVCMAIGAVVALAKMVTTKQLTRTARAMETLVRQMRTSTFGRWVEGAAPEIREAFLQLEKLCNEGDLPPLPNSLFTATALRRNGVTDGTIAVLCDGSLGVEWAQAVDGPGGKAES